MKKLLFLIILLLSPVMLKAQELADLEKIVKIKSRYELIGTLDKLGYGFVEGTSTHYHYNFHKPSTSERITFSGWLDEEKEADEGDLIFDDEEEGNSVIFVTDRYIDRRAFDKSAREQGFGSARIVSNQYRLKYEKEPGEGEDFSLFLEYKVQRSEGYELATVILQEYNPVISSVREYPDDYNSLRIDWLEWMLSMGERQPLSYLDKHLFDLGYDHCMDIDTMRYYMCESREFAGLLTDSDGRFAHAVLADLGIVIMPEDDAVSAIEDLLLANGYALPDAQGKNPTDTTGAKTKDKKKRLNDPATLSEEELMREYPFLTIDSDYYYKHTHYNKCKARIARILIDAPLQYSYRVCVLIEDDH